MKAAAGLEWSSDFNSMPREALLLSCTQRGRSKHLTAEVALLRGHLGVLLHACPRVWEVTGVISGAIAGGSLRDTSLGDVDPLVSPRNAGWVACPHKGVKIRPRLLKL